MIDKDDGDGDDDDGRTGLQRAILQQMHCIVLLDPADRMA
jgi:hypothetical protein